MKLPQDNGQAFLQRALDALHGTTGIAGRVIEQGPITDQGLRADARVDVELDGQRHPYLAQIKRVDRFAILGDIKRQCARHGDRLLLVAPRVTAEAAEKCRELDLQFIDTLGNAYLRRPGLLVLVKGQRPATGEDRQLAQPGGKRAGTASNLRVCFALLCKPQLLNAPYRDITRIAGVALGTVGGVFDDLHGRGYITGTKGKGDWMLLERQRLVQEWVTNYPIKLRPKLNPGRFRAPKPDWWKAVDITRYGAQWGAEVAAEKLTAYPRPQALTIYLHTEPGRKNLTKLVAQNRLRADPQGDIEVLDAFWEFDDGKPLPETVPPLLVYADLIATLDPRNLEAARLIHDRHLATAGAEA